MLRGLVDGIERIVFGLGLSPTLLRSWQPKKLSLLAGVSSYQPHPAPKVVQTRAFEADMPKVHTEYNISLVNVLRLTDEMHQEVAGL